MLKSLYKPVQMFSWQQYTDVVCAKSVPFVHTHIQISLCTHSQSLTTSFTVLSALTTTKMTMLLCESTIYTVFQKKFTLLVFTITKSDVEQLVRM